MFLALFLCFLRPTQQQPQLWCVSSSCPTRPLYDAQGLPSGPSSWAQEIAVSSFVPLALKMGSSTPVIGLWDASSNPVYFFSNSDTF